MRYAMKVLWLCSQPINIIAEQLDMPKVILGGWLEGIALNLVKQSDIEFFYLFPNMKHNHQDFHRVQGINFIDFGLQGLDKKIYREKFKNLLMSKSFDIIHVFGTENKILNQLILECDENKVVMSLQGIMSEIYKNNLNFIFRYHRFENRFKHFLACCLLTYNQAQFYFRARSENAVIRRIKNVIGRTDWDRICVQQLNPDIQYYSNNEILRDVFYKSSKWDIRRKEDHRIFISQGSYPLKGLHFVLKAMALLKLEYPDVRLVIAGEDITKNQALSAKIGISYSDFIQQIIHSEKLENHILFTGALTASQMNDELLKSHVFVIASTIENSPNALGEAMILGVPSVCSKVGGITSMVTDEIDGQLFESGDAFALATKIRNIFDDETQVLELSKNAIKNAEKRFNITNNISSLVAIYQSIISENCSGQPGSISE